MIQTCLFIYLRATFHFISRCSGQAWLTWPQSLQTYRWTTWVNRIYDSALSQTMAQPWECSGVGLGWHASCSFEIWASTASTSSVFSQAGGYHVGCDPHFSGEIKQQSSIRQETKEKKTDGSSDTDVGRIEAQPLRTDTVTTMWGYFWFWLDTCGQRTITVYLFVFLSVYTSVSLPFCSQATYFTLQRLHGTTKEIFKWIKENESAVSILNVKSVKWTDILTLVCCGERK